MNEEDKDDSRFVGSKDSIVPLGRFKRTEDKSSAEDKANREKAEKVLKE